MLSSGVVRVLRVNSCAIQRSPMAPYVQIMRAFRPIGAIFLIEKKSVKFSFPAAQTCSILLSGVAGGLIGSHITSMVPKTVSEASELRQITPKRAFGTCNPASRIHFSGSALKTLQQHPNQALKLASQGNNPQNGVSRGSNSA